MPKSVNEFRSQEAIDLTIVKANDKTIVGSLRIKPSSILWKETGAQKYKSVSLEDFAIWINKKGKFVSK